MLIICQRPNVFNVPYDSDCYLMMELAFGNCTWDMDRLDSAVKHAIGDIQEISNLKITNTAEPNFLQNYLPIYDFQPPIKNSGSVRQKRFISLIANSVRLLMNADKFWPLLDVQYWQHTNVTFCHHPNLQPAELLMQFNDRYLKKIMKTQPQMPLHLWLTSQLWRNPILTKLLATCKITHPIKLFTTNFGTQNSQTQHTTPPKVQHWHSFRNWHPIYRCSFDGS